MSPLAGKLEAFSIKSTALPHELVPNIYRQRLKEQFCPRGALCYGLQLVCGYLLLSFSLSLFLVLWDFFVLLFYKNVVIYVGIYVDISVK